LQKLRRELILMVLKGDFAVLGMQRMGLGVSVSGIP
jgi:hypothetical protein